MIAGSVSVFSVIISWLTFIKGILCQKQPI
jgi:hypothetical protein